VGLLTTMTISGLSAGRLAGIGRVAAADRASEAMTSLRVDVT